MCFPTSPISSRLKLSVKTKLMVVTGFLMTAVLVLVMALVSNNMAHVIEDETRKRGVAIAQLFGTANFVHLQSSYWLPVQQNARTAKSENNLSYVVVYDSRQRLIAHTEDENLVYPTPTDPEMRRLLAADSLLFRTLLLSDGSPVFDILLPVNMPNQPNRWGTVQIGISAENMYRSIRDTQLHLLQIGLFTLVLGLLGALVLAARLTKPLARLQQGSLRAAAGDLSSRIEVRSGDEMEALAENFNFMMDQIKQHQDERVRSEKLAAVGYMVNTIVHDCRTPITVIKGFASVLQEFQISAEQQRECLDFINFEVGRMERMLDEILQYAADRKTELKLEVEALDEFARDCCVEIEILLKHTAIEFSSQLNSGALVRIDRDKLRRAVLNIAGNAREALKGNGSIRLTTAHEEGQATIQVSDTGSGISPELQQKIFDPFFTHGKSGGFGLGMSITQKIVRDHAGKIQLESSLGKGTTFTIRIPVAEAHGRTTAAVGGSLQ